MLQRRPVAQHDTPRRGQRDERHSFQIRERARHRLDGEPKIIRNVPTGHRQHDVIAAIEPIGHLDEQRGEALVGALEHQPSAVARAFELAAGEDPELPRHVVFRGGQRDDGAPLDRHQGWHR